MFKFWQKNFVWTFSIISIVFTFVPEACFANFKIINNLSNEINIIINRCVFFLLVFIIALVFHIICRTIRWRVKINGHGYKICVEYGDIHKKKNCKKIINFDECYTTTVGSAPWQIKKDSICGQFLLENPIHNMKQMLDEAGILPLRGKSKFKGNEKYDLGTLLPRGDFLLMAFAPLDKDGKGNFSSRDSYIACLSKLWEEIYKYHDQKDVYVPILGSGITNFEDKSLTQQELLDIMIFSYRMSSKKIKPPYRLHIICKQTPDFSLNKIGESL